MVQLYCDFCNNASEKITEETAMSILKESSDFDWVYKEKNMWCPACIEAHEKFLKYRYGKEE